MTHAKVHIETRDGRPEAHVFRPASGATAPIPGVLFLMDGLGIRTALFDVAERIAAGGYFVLLPDLFYRAGPYVAPDPKKVFTDPDARAAWAKTMANAITPAGVREDLRAFLAHLDATPEVASDGRSIGVTGYCMGGTFALSAAGWFPDKIASVAAFHPGRVVTDDADSAHRAVAHAEGRVYVARASDDASFTDEDLGVLERALAEARVEHQIETYPAKHGWVLADTPVHDAGQAERHFDALARLFGGTLRPSAS